MELVEKLEKIAGLYQKTQQIRSEMEAFSPEDHYERKVNVPPFPGKFDSEEEREIWSDQLDHTEEDAPEFVEKMHRKHYSPEAPAKPKLREFKEDSDSALQNKQSKFGCLSTAAAAIAIFFLLGALFNLGSDALGTIIVIAVLAAGAFFAFRFLKNKAKAEEEQKLAAAKRVHDSQQADIQAEYEKKKKAYEKQCAAYEAELKDFMTAYSAWREIYIRSAEEEAEIEEKLEAERAAAVEKIYNEQYIPAVAAVNECNDLVPEEYLPVLKVLIDLIKAKRADDLKEAINLYEDILYKERQLELQRQQEEQRRYEEELRRQDEERRHQEEMAFREDQERQRRYEAEQQRRDDERRHREEARAREAEARHQEYVEKERIRKEQYKEHMARVEHENKQRQAGAAQCRACAHAGRCNMSVHNNAPTCTGFTPRR